MRISFINRLNRLNNRRTSVIGLVFFVFIAVSCGQNRSHDGQELAMGPGSNHGLSQGEGERVEEREAGSQWGSGSNLSGGTSWDSPPPPFQYKSVGTVVKPDEKKVELKLTPEEPDASEEIFVGEIKDDGRIEYPSPDVSNTNNNMPENKKTRLQGHCFGEDCKERVTFITKIDPKTKKEETVIYQEGGESLQTKTTPPPPPAELEKPAQKQQAPVTPPLPVGKPAPKPPAKPAPPEAEQKSEVKPLAPVTSPLPVGKQVPKLEPSAPPKAEKKAPSAQEPQVSSPPKVAQHSSDQALREGDGEGDREGEREGGSDGDGDRDHDHDEDLDEGADLPPQGFVSDPVTSEPPNVSKTTSNPFSISSETTNNQSENFYSPTRVFVKDTSGGAPDGTDKSKESSKPKFKMVYRPGKLNNATELPQTGQNYFVKSSSVNYRYGAERTVKIITEVMAKYINNTDSNGYSLGYKNHLVIGDLSKKNGGKLKSHRSHQNGLDFDVGYLLKIEQQHSFWPDRGNVKDAFNEKNFDASLNFQFMDLIVRTGLVYQIFVRPEIKKMLCKVVANARNTANNDKDSVDPGKKEISEKILKNLPAYEETLRRIQTDKQGKKNNNIAYGHFDHFHVRLKCPPSALSSACMVGPELPKGNGCS